MNSTGRLTLFEVSQKIQESLEETFPTNLWVIGEISELHENRSGHCYLELVEKDENSDKLKAKARGTIWFGSYRMLKPFFETSTKRSLASGIKVLVLCNINYHPVYGLSLNIIDIDPTFTIGDIEQKRQHTINQLKADGIFDMNKELDFPILPKRVAVISSPTAAGFQDFSNQVDNNQYGYSISYQLFTATMQGEKAEESVINALNQINEIIEKWDIVAIIRGGGSQIDLSCFDEYQLASNIAQFPVPVITGIGHEKDITIADMVAHTRLKTPTAVAEFVISQFVRAEDWLFETKENFRNVTYESINSDNQFLSRIQGHLVPKILMATNAEKIKLQRIMHKGIESIKVYIGNSNYALNKIKDSLETTKKIYFEKKSSNIIEPENWIRLKPKKFVETANTLLKNLEKNANVLNPENVLKRGYSITQVNGRVIKNSKDIKQGDLIETFLASGKIYSNVKEFTKSRDKLA